MYKKYDKPELDGIGRPICEICGKGYDTLGNHVKQKHGIDVADYKAEFNYNPHKGLTSETYKKKMKDFYEENKDTMQENLEKNLPYRFK